ncbi:MAG: membrane protein insertion efficiency factor YidD [Bacteroidales bacterium]|nr:membrane protein insertion efficiency factor YidD [Bacteroidales bacterium]
MTREEEALVRDYCEKRPLTRPQTSFWNIVFFILARGLFACLSGLVTLFFWHRFWGPFLLIWILLLFIDIKKGMILCIEAYQHYAPEKMRRKCICKPTCSEYAIACLQKYNVYTALRKIYIRLTRTCRGRSYIIDEP